MHGYSVLKWGIITLIRLGYEEVYQVQCMHIMKWVINFLYVIVFISRFNTPKFNGITVKNVALSISGSPSHNNTWYMAKIKYGKANSPSCNESVF